MGIVSLERGCLEDLTVRALLADLGHTSQDATRLHNHGIRGNIYSRTHVHYIHMLLNAYSTKLIQSNLKAKR